MENQTRIGCKLVIVGDGTVGKTCMLWSYTKDEVPPEYVPTIFENYSAQVQMDNITVDLTLIDTAGQGEYERLRQLTYPGTDIVIIVYSIVDKASLDNAIHQWYPEVIEKAQSAIILFVGNQIDKREDRQFASIDLLTAQKEIKQKIGANFTVLECSAIKQTGLQNVFDTALMEFVKKNNDQEKKDQPIKQEGGCQCAIF